MKAPSDSPKAQPLFPPLAVGGGGAEGHTDVPHVAEEMTGPGSSDASFIRTLNPFTRAALGNHFPHLFVLYVPA